MPSTSTLGSDDKSKIKSAIGTGSNKIHTACLARVYFAHPDPNQWSYGGLQGALAFVQDKTRNALVFRMVDLVGTRGVIWEHELYDDFEYFQDRPYFHTFAGDECMVGLVFAEENEAKIMFKKVTKESKVKPICRLTPLSVYTELTYISSESKNKLDLIRLHPHAFQVQIFPPQQDRQVPHLRPDPRLLQTRRPHGIRRRARFRLVGCRSVLDRLPRRPPGARRRREPHRPKYGLYQGVRARRAEEPACARRARAEEERAAPTGTAQARRGRFDVVSCSPCAPCAASTACTPAQSGSSSRGTAPTTCGAPSCTEHSPAEGASCTFTSSSSSSCGTASSAFASSPKQWPASASTTTTPTGSSQ